MLKRLDEKNDPKSRSTKISEIPELIAVRHSSVKHDIILYIDKMSGLVDLFSNMGTALPKEQTVSLLFLSIDVPELKAVTAAIKTLADDKVQWESVASRLIKEHMELQK